MISSVDISTKAKKQLGKLPVYIQVKFRKWVASIEENGLMETRKNPGWHDEPLKGKRAGERSIRLSLHYRAMYRVNKEIEILVIEVNKHEY